MKVILQKDIFERNEPYFTEASVKYGIKLALTDVLDEDTMLSHQEKGQNCFVIGSEAYSVDFYNSLSEGSAIIRYGVGYDSVPVDICIRRNIKVGYTPGALTDSVAEHTFALLLGVARRITQLHQSMKANLWKGITGIELKGKTIAIIGFGVIGQAVAKIAKYGFGMKVNTFDIKSYDNNNLSDYYSNVYEKVAHNADIISLHLSSSPETKGFINNETIAMMKDGVIFINTARGELVVEKDLYMALESGKIAGAGLDVFNKEPYEPDLDIDFRKLNNVVLAPHCGSNTTESNKRMAEMTIKNILAYYSYNDMTLIPEIKINRRNLTSFTRKNDDII